MIGSGRARPRGGVAAAALASRLTDRDRRIALDCYEHRVLTTEQLRRFHFHAARTARERLQELKQLQVLTSFRPPRQPGEGSAQNHWVLDEAGALTVAAELGVERSQLRWNAPMAIAIASSSKLPHTLAVNDFITRLSEDTEAAGGALEARWGERRSQQLLGGAVNPDGYCRIRLPDGSRVELLVELDRGTEDHQRLHEKARRYAKALPRSDLRHPLVLLLVPSAARAQRAAAALDTSAAPIVTAVWTPDSTISPLTLLRQASPHAHQVGPPDSAQPRQQGGTPANDDTKQQPGSHQTLR